MAAIDDKAFKLYKEDPKLAEDFLTEYTKSNMEKIVKMYRDLRTLLITRYTNNKLGL